MSEPDPNGECEPDILSPDARGRLAEWVASEHARRRYTPVDYSRMLTGTIVPDLTGADQVPEEEASFLLARGQALVEDLEHLRDAAEPFDLFGGERKRRHEALAATATVLRAEEYLAAAGEVASELLEPADAPPEMRFETVSLAAHEAATTFFTHELAARSARLAALLDLHAEPVGETSKDRTLDETDRAVLAELLARDVAGCRSALDRLATSRLVDTMMGAMLDAVSTLSRAFVFALSQYQRQRDELRRRRAGRRRLAVTAVAALFALFIVFADKALDASWPTEVIGSALLALVLFLADRYREAAMERRTWRRRLTLLQGQVVTTTHYLVALRMQQSFDDVDRRLRGQPARVLADWTQFS